MHAWTVTGVVNNNGFLGTVFACTNTLSSNVIVGVEVFGPGGGPALNDASATSLTVAPGATVIFGTSDIAGLEVDSILGFALTKGSARVLTTTSFKASQQILCTAFNLHGTSNPPSVMTTLPVFRR